MKTGNYSNHFASVNVSFANKLHSEFIISDFFRINRNVPINEYQFSDFLAQIIDLYGSSKLKLKNTMSRNEWEKVEMSMILFHRDKTRQYMKTLLGYIPNI